MTFNSPWNKLKLYFHMREEIKVLFLKFACQSRLPNKVVFTVPIHEYRMLVSDRSISRNGGKYWVFLVKPVELKGGQLNSFRRYIEFFRERCKMKLGYFKSNHLSRWSLPEKSILLSLDSENNILQKIYMMGRISRMCVLGGSHKKQVGHTRAPFFCI